MAGIFTRKEISKILGDENLTPEERADQIFSLYGRALDDGYITRNAADAAQTAAIESARKEWEKNQPKVNVLETPEYKELQGKFEGYKTKQTARNSEEFKELSALRKADAVHQTGKPAAGTDRLGAGRSAQSVCRGHVCGYLCLSGLQ